MKHTVLALLLVFCLLLTGSIAAGEDVQPEEAELELPVPYSLGDFLNRYPDNEISNEDGSITEIFTGITMETFNAFLAHMSDSEMKNRKIREVKVENQNIREGENHTIFLGELYFINIEYKEYEDENGNKALMDNTSDEYGELNKKYQNVSKVKINGKLAKPTLSFCFYTEAGELQITYPKPYYDTRVKTAKANFELMVSYAEANQIKEAIDAYEAIPDAALYQPVAEYMASHPELAPVMITARYKMPGEYISFGRYEQDNNPDNGPEAIEWLVLRYDEDSNRSLLVSRYALDAVPYNAEYGDVSWEESSLRTWLNSDFLNAAFTVEELGAVPDQVSLLSSDEVSADEAFPDDEARKCYPTAYAVSRGVRGSTEDRACSWWLRSPGSVPSCGGRVNSAGTICSAFVDYEEAAVRPVIWIDLNSEYYKSN